MLLTRLVSRVHRAVGASLLVPKPEVFQMLLTEVVPQLQCTSANQLQRHIIKGIPFGQHLLDHLPRRDAQQGQLAHTQLVEQCPRCGCKLLFRAQIHGLQGRCQARPLFHETYFR